jgi:hypothetical protein
MGNVGTTVAVTNALPADLTEMLATIRAIGRERRMIDHQRDSLVVQTAKEIERERLAAVAGHEHFEPQERMGD